MAIYGQMLNKSLLFIATRILFVEVKFLAETNTLVDTRRFTIYKIINLWKRLLSGKIRWKAPQSKLYSRMEVLNATAYEMKIEEEREIKYGSQWQVPDESVHILLSQWSSRTLARASWMDYSGWLMSLVIKITNHWWVVISGLRALKFGGLK